MLTYIFEYIFTSTHKQYIEELLITFHPLVQSMRLSVSDGLSGVVQDKLPNTPKR